MKQRGYTVGHGVGCVVFTAEGHIVDQNTIAERPVALMFTAKEAERLGIRLIQQAGYARHSADVAKDKADGVDGWPIGGDTR